MTASKPRTWFITGASRGLGRALAAAVLAHGDQVIATARRPDALAALARQHKDRVRCHALDVDDAAACQQVLNVAVNDFGGLDVLVNNAGYGLAGAIEELTEAEARSQIETNVFGALRLTRLVLPHMRRRNAGHIVQISSIAGFAASPGLGLYNASKFALEGFSEALAQEVAPFGIHVTLVEPGPFRTDWAGPSLATAQQRIDAYADTAHKTIATLYGYSGAQPGDPAKAAAVIIQAVESAQPPLHLPLGRWAVDRMREKMRTLSTEIDAWEAVALATDFTQES